MLISPLYNLGIQVRKALYQRGWYTITELPAPVLSVGNISLGGTGKTPLVCYLVEEALRHGYKPLVLSRGYGRREKKAVLVLPNAPLPSVEEIGDEPYLIKSKLPECTLLVHPKRGQVAKERWAELDCNFVILDDAFQHWSIKRDYDFITMDVTQNWSLLPQGRLREPLKALRRADAIVYTRTNEISPEELELRTSHLKPFLQSPREKQPWKKHVMEKAPFFFADLQFQGIKKKNGSSIKIEEWKKKPLCLLTGVGNPKSVRKIVEKQGLTIAQHLVFPDHHQLRAREIQKIEETKKNFFLLTTEKDFVRWRNILKDRELHYIQIALSVPFLFDLIHSKKNKKR